MRALAALAAPLIVLALALPGHARELDVPFVPTPQSVVKEMLQMAKAGPDDVLYDLGSGDGRIVIAAVRDFGVKRAVGIDLNPERVKEANDNARHADVTDKVEFLEANIFEHDFSEATVVTMYLLTQVNLKLRPRLLSELKPGTRIVSHQFNMGDWEPDETKTLSGRDIYFWVVPAKVEGKWQWSDGGDTYEVELRQHYQKLEGVLKVGGKEVPLRNARVNGEQVTFTAEVDGKPRSFEGKLKGEQLVIAGNGGEGGAVARRVL